MKGNIDSVISSMTENELRDFLRFSVRKHADLSEKLMKEYMGYLKHPDYDLVRNEFYALEESYKCRWRMLGMEASTSYIGKLDWLISTYIPPMVRGGHWKEAYGLISEMYRRVIRYDLWDDAWFELSATLPDIVLSCVKAGGEEGRAWIVDDMRAIRSEGDIMFAEGGAVMWKTMGALTRKTDEVERMLEWTLDILETENPEGLLLCEAVDYAARAMETLGKTADEIEAFREKYPGSDLECWGY